MMNIWLKYACISLSNILMISVVIGHTGMRFEQNKYARDLNNKSALVLMPGSGGRLGDQFIFYTAAKWYSWNWDIPFLYNPSPHLNGLVLDIEDVEYFSEREHQFDNEEIITFNTQHDHNKRVLYRLPFAQACACVSRILRKPDVHKEFLERLRATIRPRHMVKTIPISKEVITVAVHVRKGSGADIHQSKQRFARKFLTDRYYIDQIRKLSEYFKDRALHVYLFSDYADMTILKQYYESALSDKKNILLICNNDFHYQDDLDGLIRKRTPESNSIKELYGDAYKGTIISDLYSMISCDCLIRSHSFFARSAEILGEHKIVVSPKQLHWNQERSEVVVESVHFVVKDHEWCARKLYTDETKI